MRGRVLRRLVIIAVLGAFGLAPNTVFAQAQKPQVPDAAASDPSPLGWMVGSPPPAGRIIRFSDGSFYKFPQRHWSFSNMRQLVPTANVARGSGRVVLLPRVERPDLDAIAFTTMDGRKMTWMQSLPVLCADGIVVLHRGAIGLRQRHRAPGHGHDHRRVVLGGLLRPERGSLRLCASGRNDAEAGETRRGLRISGRQYRGAGVDPHAHHGPGAGAPHIGADLVEAWGGARCLLHRGRHRHRMGRRRPRTDRGSRQR